MQVDVLLDPFGARWSELRDTAHAAVDAGFAGIWTFDHLDGRVYRAPHVLECWTVLSAIAGAMRERFLVILRLLRQELPPRSWP